MIVLRAVMYADFSKNSDMLKLYIVLIFKWTEAAILFIDEGFSQSKSERYVCTFYFCCKCWSIRDLFLCDR